MEKIVDVQLRKGGKIYTFRSGPFVLHKGSKVIVMTEQGEALGTVCSEPKKLEGFKSKSRPKPISRLATWNEAEKWGKNCDTEKKIYGYCYDRIKSRNLQMSLVAVERLFDGSKVIVYFSAEGRIDFRELVKDLVHQFHTRIEMRQIGVRHQAKMVGGLGNCGRQLCCISFLSQFSPVSIKMAKEQNLSLNPSKISGMCGRLMCCLTYEYKHYEEVKKNLPKIGKRVNTKFGEVKVIRQNLLRGTITVQISSGEEKEISYEDVIRKK